MSLCQPNFLYAFPLTLHKEVGLEILKINVEKNIEC